MKMQKVCIPLILGIFFVTIVLWLLGYPPVIRADPGSHPLLNNFTVGSSPGCSTIQACIDNASGGATIFIPSGLYVESITLAKAVSLIGAGSIQTTLQAPNNQRVLEINGPTINNTVIISGLTITGGPRPAMGLGSLSGALPRR